MAIDVDAGVLKAMSASTGAIRLLVVSGDEDLRGALQDAVQRVLRIPHPEEPDEPFASWAGPVERSGDGWVLSLDMADAEAYEGILEAVIRCVVEALEAAGVVQAQVSAAPRRTVAHPPAATTAPRISRLPEPTGGPPPPPVPERQALEWLARQAVPTVLGRAGISFQALPPVTQPFELTAVTRSLAAAVAETMQRIEESRDERASEEADETAAQERINRTIAEATVAAADWSHRARLCVVFWKKMPADAQAAVPLDSFVLMSIAAEMATAEWTAAWGELAGIELDTLQPPAVGFTLGPFVYGQGAGTPVAAVRSSAPDTVPEDVADATLAAVDERLTQTLPALIRPYAHAIVAGFAIVAVEYGFLLLAPADKLSLAEELTTSWAQVVAATSPP